MKKNFWIILSIIVIAISVVMLVYQLFIAEEKNMRLIRRGVSLLILYLICLYRVTRRPRFNRRAYERTYAPYLGHAFRNDKKSYRLLLKAITLFNTDKSQQAIGYLYQLENNCADADDFGAVYFFMALCFEELDMTPNAVESYEKLLSHKPDHSMGLSNLGLIYQRKGQYEKAEQLYKKAIASDPDNPYGYSNLANLYLRMSLPERALEEAKKSIAINPDINPAISAAALSCTLLGRTDEAEEYCRLYGKHGGNSKELRKIISDSKVLGAFEI